MAMTQEDRRKRDRVRSRRWHERRRTAGICGLAPCTRKPEINPRTGQPFWACRSCRAARRRGQEA